MNKRIDARKIVVVSLVGLMVLALSVGLGATEARRGGRLVIGIVHEPHNLDPQQMFWGTVIHATFLQPLIQLDSDGNVVPDLARWEVSEDGKVLTFYILPGTRFSNGDPLNAEAFKKAIERYKVLSPYAADFDPVIGVEVVDEYTLKLILDAPAAFMVAVLTSMYGAAVNVRIAEEVGDEAFAEEPIGSGPFKLKEWVHGSHIVVERNIYFRTGLPFLVNPGPPHLDEIEFRFIPEGLTRVAELEAGTLDMIFDVPTIDVRRLREDPRFQMWEILSPGVCHLVFNTRRPPFDDVLVRQAVATAIDRRPIVMLLDPVVIPFHALLSPAQISHCIEVEEWGKARFPYDVEEARRLLAQAGWVDTDGNRVVDKDGVPLRVVLLSPVDDPLRAEIALIILTQLRAIGIDVEIHELTMAHMGVKTRGGNFDLALGRYSWPDPDILYFQFVVEPTHSGWIYPEVVALLREGRFTMDPEERREIYAQAQKIILENAPIVPLFVRKTFTVAWNHVRGLLVDPFFGTIFNDVTLKRR
jgi:peptide/nickel transport system substrate-binding protein